MIEDDDYIGFIDKNGELIIPYQFAEVRPFEEDAAAVRFNNNWYFISRNNGTIMINESFDYAENFNNGIARVQVGEEENIRYGYINKKGEYIWYPTR